MTPLEHDQVRYALVSHVDITDRKQSEIAVGEYAEKLQARNEALATVNHLVRHDIRNDMEVVLGWAEVLEEYVDEEGRPYLGDIRDTGRQVVDLAGAVGEVAEAMADGTPELEPVDPVSVVEDELQKARQSYQDQPVTLVGPDAPPEVTVLADDLLASVVGNLIDNAVLHNDHEDPRVEVSVESTGDRVTIRVDDDGPGIPESATSDVRDQGQRGPESSGSGLGLYLVDRLVDRYGGELQIAGSDLGGASVRVSLQQPQQAR